MAVKLELIDLDNSGKGSAGKRRNKDLQFPDLYEKTYKERFIDNLLKIVERFALFAGVLIYLETLFHLWAFKGLDANYWCILLLVLPLSAILSLAVSFFSKKVNKIVTWVLVGVAIVWYIVALMYYSIFKVFFSIQLLDKGNMKVVQYYREIGEGLLHNWWMILLIVAVPIVAINVCSYFEILKFKKAEFKFAYINVVLAAIAVGLICLIIPLYGKQEFSPYDQMKYVNTTEVSVKKLGVLATMQIEMRNAISPREMNFGDDTGLEDEVWVYVPEDNTQNDPFNLSAQGDPSQLTNPDASGNGGTLGNNPDATGDNQDGGNTSGDNPGGNTSGDNQSSDSTSGDATGSPQKKVDTSPNIWDLDFVSLSESETNSNIADIHKYFSTVSPSFKNEYTGMFEGYNLIFMTAESFSTWAIDEKLTPTLYKLTHEGFVFNNFYNPRTGGSTSDGEFVCSTSLMPVCGAAKNFRIVGQESMPLALGNMFNMKYGITSRAYHDNDYQYYGRDISYPSLGYYYQGRGNGLEIPSHWPCSDLDMMEATVDEYMNDDIFNVYYMTVSGHLNYNFSGNYCAKIHQEDVADLPYSEACKAYIACNMELDRACEYLINQLEERGIADRTVICFTGDHWPYGLSNEEISEFMDHDVEENFELYKSSLVLWSGSIKEPIVIDKACCSYDILPTLLNLFGFDYDSRLLMGRDILSTTEGFVMFINRSFLTNEVMYNSQTGEAIWLNEGEDDGSIVLSDELKDVYIKRLKRQLNNRWKYSAAIMDNDYYSYICKALGKEIPVVQQNYTPDYSRFSR